MPRRAALVALAATTCQLACNGSEPPPKLPLPPPPPDLQVGALTDLLTVVRLRWLVRIEPHRLRSIEWLKAALAPIIRDERLELLAQMTGVDLRIVPEVVLAGYRGSGPASDDDAIAYFVRHDSEALIIERKFRARLTSRERRGAHGHQLVSAWGNIGTTPHGFVAIGPDVAGYQYGGSRREGPARIAMLYAQGKLTGVPTVLADPTLAQLHVALTAAQEGGDAARTPPLELLMPGPFEDELARGARGLLAASTGVGAALAPTAKRTLRLLVLVAGAYGSERDRDQAVRLLGLAWKDLANSDLGHLLGLHAPITPAIPRALDEALALIVELDANRLFDGLAAATVSSVEEIMK